MIDADGLALDYGATHALRGASLRVGGGEIVALLGANGAGKSTLLLILAGVLAPDGGRATVAGVPLPDAEGALARKVGFVPQGESLYPELSVQENLRFFGRLHGLRGRRLRERVETLVQRTGLGEKRRVRTGRLSGGQRQRLAVACSLLHDPPVLLLDEPGTGLDPYARELLADLLREAKARGAAVLLSTHDLDEARRVADRVVFLREGKAVADLPASEAARLEDAFRLKGADA